MSRLEPLIFEISKPGRKSYSLPSLEVEKKPMSDYLPAGELRNTPAELPEVAEVDLIRHFTRLSQLNHGVDIGFYPLGSCTMKYNPKINEEVANLPGSPISTRTPRKKPSREPRSSCMNYRSTGRDRRYG